MSNSCAAAEAIVSGYAARGGAPAIAYGIVRDGELVHAGGTGERVVGGPAPDADTVFRIASMTKSFTASAVLLLRDEGALALDDPAERYVPELADWAGPAGEAEGGRLPELAGPVADRVTLRHLLTMTAGFPTDDPWGDRQQGLPLEAFRSLLAGGVSANWAPGTRFEYSNLGYAILGLVITAVSGLSYDDFVRMRLLRPLGMTRTGYEAAEFPGGNLALGYRRGLSGWEQVPFDPHGAFAPMGGVLSCVRDLATWVSGFALAFPPSAMAVPPAVLVPAPSLLSDAAPAAEVGDWHPLRPASRRDMQLSQVVIPPTRGYPLPGGPSGGLGAYGFGLFIDEDPALGRIVSHSGGYPGFGSNMRWHPATGTGVIALGNGTYAPMTQLTNLIMETLVSRRPSAYQVALAPAAAPGAQQSPHPRGGPWPETLAARAAVSHLLANWDEATADALFTENVALDRPYAERLHDIALLRDRLGTFADSSERGPEHDTPAHCRWFLTGEDGTTVQAQIQLNPQRPPRVQSLTLAIPPAVGSPLAKTLDAIIAWLNSGLKSWPDSVAVATGTDAGLLSRRLRMAAAWTGTVAAGAYRAGDGAAGVTVELDGEHASVLLTVLVDPSTGTLRAADTSV